MKYGRGVDLRSSSKNARLVGRTCQQMYKFALSALCVSTLLVCSVAANAQSDAEMEGKPQNPLTLKIGGFLPADTSARNYGGTVQLSGGGELVVGGTEKTTGVVYFDAQGQKHSGGHVYSYGGGLAVRQKASSFAQGITPYGGAGIGYYVSDVKAGWLVGSERKGGFGAKLFGGLEFGHNVIGELSYQFLPTSADINPSGFTFQVGLRL